MSVSLAFYNVHYRFWFQRKNTLFAGTWWYATLCFVFPVQPEFLKWKRSRFVAKISISFSRILIFARLDIFTVSNENDCWSWSCGWSWWKTNLVLEVNDKKNEEEMDAVFERINNLFPGKFHFFLGDLCGDFRNFWGINWCNWLWCWWSDNKRLLV